MAADGGHDRAHLGDGATAKVVAVREAARDGDEIGRPGELGVLVPGDDGRHADQVAQRMNHLGIGVGAGKHDDGRVHGGAVYPVETAGARPAFSASRENNAAAAQQV